MQQCSSGNRQNARVNVEGLHSQDRYDVYENGRMKLCLARANYTHSAATTYKQELVEADSGRFGVTKKRGAHGRVKEASNLGRSLVTVGRFARRHWALHGLHDRHGKSSRLGPETVDEVQPVLAGKLGAAAVGMGKAFRLSGQTPRRSLGAIYDKRAWSRGGGSP